MKNEDLKTGDLVIMHGFIGIWVEPYYIDLIDYAGGSKFDNIIDYISDITYVSKGNGFYWGFPCLLPDKKLDMSSLTENEQEKITLMLTSKDPDSILFARELLKISNIL